jgi:hypothetical protein
LLKLGWSILSDSLSGIWWNTNYETQLAYGLAITEDYPEGRMGYIHLDELRSVRLPMNLRIVRDGSYRPTRVSELVPALVCV